MSGRAPIIAGGQLGFTVPSAPEPSEELLQYGGETVSYSSENVEY